LVFTLYSNFPFKIQLEWWTSFKIFIKRELMTFWWNIMFYLVVVTINVWSYLILCPISLLKALTLVLKYFLLLRLIIYWWLGERARYFFGICIKCSWWKLFKNHITTMWPKCVVILLKKTCWHAPLMECWFSMIFYKI